MACEHALHGRKTNIPWFDHVTCDGSTYNKTRLARNRRRDDRALVTALAGELCDCPSCRGGHERDCWASRNADDNGCPQPGNGGWHSAAYYDDGSCAWCGLVQGRTSLGTLGRLP